VLCNVALDDDNHEKVAIISTVLSTLPPYNKAIVHELFHLLARVASYADVNLMSSDNLATIFGGMGNFMTNILTSTERTEIVKFMIDNYDTLFEVRVHDAKYLFSFVRLSNIRTNSIASRRIDHD
jgi:hypothetical protein